MDTPSSPGQTPARAEPIDALREDVHALGDLVGEVLREQAGAEIFALVEHVRTAAIALRSPGAHSPAGEQELLAWAQRQSTDDLVRVIRAFTVYFHVINAAEQNHRVRRLREREADGAALPESIAAAARLLRDQGVPASALYDVLLRLRVRPVFTAHPSEARRPTLLHHLERLADLLAQRDTERAHPRQQAAIADALRARISLIWQTAETRAEQPSVLDEVQSVLGVVAGTVYAVAPRVQRELETAIRLEFSSGTPVKTQPFLRAGSWVGGDRDGNPHVNADVTRAAVRLARTAVLRRYREEVQALGLDLSISQRLVGASPELLASLERDRALLGSQPVPQWADEPYRRKCGLIAERLLRATEDAPGGYETADDLLADLRMLRASLEAHAGQRIAAGALRDLELRVALFGFHLTELEIRQHAQRYTAAMAELVRLTRGDDYAALGEADRVALLEAVLAGPVLAPPMAALSPATRDVLETFQAMAEIQQRYGAAACQTAIISMCRAPSDVLAVLALAREAGLFTWTGGTESVCKVDIVPLFEEVRELRQSGDVLSQLLQRPAYRAALAGRGWHQQVMIGYSDSNKAAGYVAATWETYRAQEALARVAAVAGLELEIFHGRGGAVGRGGGPMGRAILARPPYARFPVLKVTEQGEVIFARYSHPAIAERHFEQILHALLRSSLDTRGDAPPREWQETMERLAQRSRQVYEEQVKDSPEFLRFFRQVTPFPELSSLNLASRPVSRSGKTTLTLDDLRAIPWSFSWTQIRANLPGWFGLGSALAEEIAAGGLPRLQTMYTGWRFFAMAMDNAQRSLGIADMPTLHRYTTLAEKGESFYQRLLEEYDRSVASVLQVTRQGTLLEGSSVLARSIRLRNPYVDALHVAQIALLHRYRGLPADAPTAEREQLLDAIHHSINGIAAGLQETG